MNTFSDINDYSIVVGGNWNFILDKDKDAYGGNPKLKLNSIAEHTKLKSKFALCDIFRIRNKNFEKIHFQTKNTMFGKETR